MSHEVPCLTSAFIIELHKSLSWLRIMLCLLLSQPHSVLKQQIIPIPLAKLAYGTQDLVVRELQSHGDSVPVCLAVSLQLSSHFAVSF